MRTNIMLIVGALALGGCPSSRTNEEPQAAAEATPPEAAAPEAAAPQSQRGEALRGGAMADMCPAAVEGTTVRAEDVEGGAAMVFTTTGDVAELRRRVAHVAEMHERHQTEGRGSPRGDGPHARGGPMGGGPPPPRGGMQAGGPMMPPSTARSEDIEGGARIVLAPRDPAELAALREHVRQHAEQMASGRCPMMTM